MATITIACPKCENQIKVPPDLEGKKIRCKECTHVFVVKLPAAAKAAAKAATKSAKADKKPAKEKEAAKGHADGGDDDGKAYGVTDHDLSVRAHCANELDSEDQVICLNCGYNHQTRERIQTDKTYDPTGGEWFIHLLPGIACALGVLLLVGAIVLVWVMFPKWAEGNDEWWAILVGLASRIWSTIIALFIGTFLGKFAVKRLILNARPPERKMKSRKKSSRPREQPLTRASLRLASLWVSQSARSLADWCLRLFVVLEIAGAGQRERNFAPHLVTAVYVAPFILLAPVNGALSNALRKRWVLVASAAFCLVGVAAVALFGGPWLLAVGLIAVGMAVYSPTRYALLPAAAESTGIPLPRVMGWTEMGAAAAIVGGALLGIALHGVSWSFGPVPAAVGVTLGVSALALLTALPAEFAADVRRAEPPLAAVAGFFRDARRVLGERAARGSLAGLAAFMALVAGGAGALVSYTLEPRFAAGAPSLAGRLGLTPLELAMVLVAVGAAAGSWLAGRQPDLHLGLGLVPISATVLLASLAWAVFRGDLTGTCVVIGLTTGLANVPLRSYYQAAVPADARGNGMSVMNTAIFVATTALMAGMFLLTWSGVVGSGLAQLGVIALLAAAFAVAAWRRLSGAALRQGVQIMNAGRRLGRRRTAARDDSLPV